VERIYGFGKKHNRREELKIRQKIWGTAGTGKTTSLLTMVDNFLGMGYDFKDIVFCTFNANMADEFNTRLFQKYDLGYYDPKKASQDPRFRYMSTIHGVCNRSLNDIEWKEESAEEHKELFCKSIGIRYTGKRDTRMRGDLFFETKSWLINTFRQNHDSRAFGMGYRDYLLPSEYVYYLNKWDTYKEKLGIRDFDDMLLLAYERKLIPPNKKILLVDEFQDLSPLQYAIYKHWRDNMEHVVICGDPNQAIYSFQGATPAHFEQEELEEKTLPKTYRLGKHGWAYAQEILKWYHLPTPVVEHNEEREDNPVRMVSVEGMLRHIDQSHKTYVVAQTNDMAFDLASQLDEWGIPHYGTGGWGHVMQAIYNCQLLMKKRKGYVTPDEALEYYGALRKAHILPSVVKLRTRDMPRDMSFHSLTLHMSPLSVAQIASDPMDFSIFKDSVFPKEEEKRETINRKKKIQQALVKPNADFVGRELGVYIGTIHCSPADELILTTEGYVPICDLVPAQHRLGGYYRKCNKLQWGTDNTKKGYAFQITARDYNGTLLTIETTRSKTRVTPNHILPVALADSFMEKYVVYLMRRGDWWRVGVCVSAHRPYRSGGVAGRMATEKADCGWVLGVFDTREEALLHEAIIQGQFGVTGLTFESVSKERSLSTTQLHKIHNMISGGVCPRALQVLHSYGMLPEHPLYTRATLGSDGIKRNMRGIFETAAANIISGYMEVLVPQTSFITRENNFNTKADRLLATVTPSHYVGTVYGLDVKPHHHYVSGGAVVHNSVKGKQASDVFLYDGISRLSDYAITFHHAKQDVARLFFVGATRHMKNLYIIDSGRSFKFDLPKAKR
jgi:hypothetical protein